VVGNCLTGRVVFPRFRRLPVFCRRAGYGRVPARGPGFLLVPAFLLKTAIDSLFPQEEPFSLPLVPQPVLPTGLPEQILLLFGLLVAAYALGRF